MVGQGYFKGALGNFACGAETRGYICKRLTVNEHKNEWGKRVSPLDITALCVQRKPISLETGATASIRELTVTPWGSCVTASISRESMLSPGGVCAIYNQAISTWGGCAFDRAVEMPGVSRSSQGAKTMSAQQIEKLDLLTQYKELYRPPANRVVVVDAPAMSFLMIDGKGDPNTAQSYREAIEALYSLSYTLKFSAKQERGLDYHVMPLEGLWWVENMADFVMANKEAYQWTAMIAQPDFITPALMEEAKEQVAQKKQLPALASVRLETFHEGVAAQIMHIGPYSAEAPTIARLHSFIDEQGYVRRGKHHEIYLGDPRRASPSKLKTIIRQPIARSDAKE